MIEQHNHELQFIYLIIVTTNCLAKVDSPDPDELPSEAKEAENSPQSRWNSLKLLKVEGNGVEKRVWNPPF